MLEKGNKNDDLHNASLLVEALDLATWTVTIQEHAVHSESS